MSKIDMGGLYLCWLKPEHESCADHNRKVIVDRIMKPLEVWAASLERVWNWEMENEN